MPEPGSMAVDRRAHGILPGLAILFLAALAFLPALRNGFVWDDDYMVTDNPALKAANGLHLIWASTQLRDFFPLTYSTFWLEWRCWGMNAAGYHLTNILLHACSAVFFWRVLQRLRVPGAWLAAAIFAVHPVNVESVAWIAERKNTLAMFFYTLALLSYLRFDAEEPPKWKWYLFSLLAFLLALLSKTAVVMLPFVLLLCAWWRRGKITFQDCQRSAPFFALAFLLGLVTIWFQYNRTIGQDVVSPGGFATRLIMAGWACWFYIYKALLPLHLAFVYPRWQIDPHSIVSYLPGIALVIVFLAGWKFRQYWGKPLLFGLGYFVLMLFPEMGFFKIYFQRFSLVADHWQYFSIIGIIALATGFAAWIFHRNFQRRIVRWFGIFLSAAILAIFFILTWKQTNLYIDSATLWRDTLAKNPNCWLADNNLGTLLLSQEELAEARTHFESALRSNPNYPEAKVGMGCIFADEGNNDGAIQYYNEALRLDPNSTDAHYDLGNTFLKMNRLNDALAQYQAAVKLNPGRGSIHENLGIALLKAGKPEQAISELMDAVRLAPDSFAAHNDLGSALLSTGKLDDAIAEFRAAKKINPTVADIHKNLGDALSRTGKMDEAMAEYRSAVEMQPGNGPAQSELAGLLFRANRLDEAAKHYRAALALDATNAVTIYNLGQVFVAEKKLPVAISYFREALRLDSSFIQARLDLSDALVSIGRMEEAAQIDDETIKISSNCFRAYNSLGCISAMQGQTEKAIELLDKAIQIAPDYGEAQYNLAHILAGKKQWDAAAPHYQAALRATPNDPQIEFEFAATLSNLGRTNEAVALLNAAVRLQPDFSPAVKLLKSLQPN